MRGPIHCSLKPALLHVVSSDFLCSVTSLQCTSVAIPSGRFIVEGMGRLEANGGISIWILSLVNTTVVIEFLEKVIKNLCRMSELLEMVRSEVNL